MYFLKRILARPVFDPAEFLERVAYRLTHEFTTTASFRSTGRLLPWQEEALSLVIQLQMEVQQ